MNQSLFLFSEQTVAMDTTENEAVVSLSKEHILMSQIAKGSHIALEQLIDNWKDSLFRFFDRSLNNKADAEDLTQKVFIRIYQSASKYQPRAKFSTYLFTVARNLLIDEINKKNRFHVSVYDDDWIQNQVDERHVELAEWNELLNHAMKEMPEYFRTSLLLRVQKELSYSEIAEIMKVSESRVKTWIHRARGHLKKSLKSWIK